MMSASGRRGLQAAAAAEVLMAASPQRAHSSMSYYRPSSVHSQSNVCPVSARSEFNERPRTPGGSSIGLNTRVTVENRPVTHHGMISMRTPSQGPGRKVLDKSYFLAKLRSKKQELQTEIDTMTLEIDRLQKRGPASVHLEHHQESLVEEVKLLRRQLGDHNMVMENVAAGVELEQLKSNLETMKENVDKERQTSVQLFSEKAEKGKEIREFEDKICLLESEMERRLDKAVDKKVRYLEIKRENQELTDEIQELRNKLDNLNLSLKPLEQDLAKASPAKQKTVVLVEQCLAGESEVRRLKSEITSVAQLSPAEAREAMLSQIRQDNAEIARAEEKSLTLQSDIKLLEEKNLTADAVLSEIKGGRAERFLEMQEKDKKMQSFIDNYEAMHRERSEAARVVKQKIDLLLEHVDCSDVDASSTDISKDVKSLQQDLEERKRELKQLEEMELKTRREIAACRQKITFEQAEIEKFTRLDDVRAASEAKSSMLEQEKKTIDEKILSVQAQLKEQTLILESMHKQVNESPMHKNLETLNQKLLSIQRSICQAQEEIEAKERDLNYKPVLENVRFMVAQLNDEIKTRVIH